MLFYRKKFLKRFQGVSFIFEERIKYPLKDSQQIQPTILAVDWSRKHRLMLNHFFFHGKFSQLFHSLKS